MEALGQDENGLRSLDDPLLNPGRDSDIDSDDVEIASRQDADDATASVSPRDSGDASSVVSAYTNFTATTAQPAKMSGLAGASCNLINAIFGTGIVALPFAIKSCGLFSGILLLVFIACLMHKSIRTVVELMAFHPKLVGRNVTTLEDLSSYSMGPAGRVVVLFFMLIMSLGFMTSYLIVIKDTVPILLGVEENDRLNRSLLVVGVSLFVMVPISLQRDVASLSSTSSVSVIIDAVLVVFVAAFSPVERAVANEGGVKEVIDHYAWIKPSTLFVGLGIISSAFATQHVVCLVGGSLANRTRRRWNMVTNLSLGIAVLLSLTISVSGFLGFLGDTRGNILNNFPPGSFVASSARLLLASTMLFTYPIEVFVARHVLVSLFHGGEMEAPLFPVAATVRDDGSSRSQRLCWCKRRHYWTIVVYIMTLIPALLFDDLGIIFSLTGSIGVSYVSYVLPGLLYLGINGTEFLAAAKDILQIQSLRSCLRYKGHQDEDPSDETEEFFDVVDNSVDPERIPGTGSSQDGHTKIDLSGPKPFWWYLAGMPLWCAIASKGSKNLANKLNDSTMTPTDADSRSEFYRANILPPPTLGDYCGAIFLILFGVAAGVIGVFSALYLGLMS